MIGPVELALAVILATLFLTYKLVEDRWIESRHRSHWGEWLDDGGKIEDDEL